MFGTAAQPLVSIIIPVYNAEDYLNESMRSVLMQTYKNLEIICIDDGSVDNSRALLEKLASDDQRISVISVENKGAGNARNLGMDKAKGKYILFFDADDVLRKDMIRTLVKTAEKNNPDIVLFGYYKFADGKKIRTDFSAKTLKVPMNRIISPDTVSDRLFQADHGMPWNKFYNAGFLRSSKIRFQELKNTNDEFFSRITTVSAGRIFFLGKVLIGYRVGNKKSLRGDADRNILECTRALLAIHDELRVRGCLDEYSDTFKKLVGYVIMLKLRSASDPDAFAELAREVSDNTFRLCEMDEDHLEECYKEAYRALLSKDFTKAGQELERLM